MVQFNKLKLTGFKSFVEPTELEIGQGLTGIVGPNGCGKSNLVEALRWAMGENSPKRMRSSGMNDVIFAGTEKRPARTTAEVLLELDNTDRTAPAEINDSDELQISRKIERDVGSVYKVNGKNVRMRDVQLLFADSSIGAHSPALVSQGRVADMINAKPQQRRMVLEEAAGISGLHARRHEAELKLRAAEQNLVRVEDVMGAMNIQLDALKKQSRQASRYRNLNGHIQTTEGSLLYLRWMASTTAVEKALEAFQSAETIVRDKTISVTELTTKQTEAAADLPELRKKEAEAAAGLQHLKLAYGSLDAEAQQVQEDKTKSENLLQQFTADIEHEKTQKVEATETTERLGAEFKALEEASTQQAESEEAARILTEEQQAKVKTVENELSTLTEEVATLEASRRSGERQIQDLERRFEQLTNRKTNLENEHETLVANTPAKAELEEITTQIAPSEELYQTATEIFECAELERSDADVKVQETTDVFQTTQKFLNGLTAEADGLRRVLQSNQQSDEYEPVLDKVSVETGLEKALAVALGDDLQATLDGAAPIHWKELPDFSETSDLPAQAKPLSQSVEAPRALSRTLSQIGVVENAAIAEAIMSDLKPGQCLVTLDGGAWRWDGLVVSPDAENSAAIRLEQKNRLSELEEQILTAEISFKEARTAMDCAKETHAEIIDAVNTARHALKSAENTLKELRRKQAQLSEQLAEVTARLSGISASIENAAEEIIVISTELEEARSSFANLPESEEGREKITALKELLTEHRQNLAEQQATYAEIRREGENRKRRMDQIKDEIAVWTSRLERVEYRLIELDERIAHETGILERLAERPEQIETEKQSLMTHISEAEIKRQDAADILISTENTSNELQRELRAIESALSDAREARAMAQADVNTSEHTQSGIEAQIMEKFSCAASEIVAKLELNLENMPEIDPLQSKLDRLLRERDNMGPVNLRAEVESAEISEKMTEMETDRDDLMAAIDKLREGINKLNKEARERLLIAFDVVNKHFQELFTRLFNGGAAYLKLVDAEDPLNAGLEIFAQPPGKKLQVLSLLSGGEQTLTSIALIFGMFLTNPAPICVLDEVDAPLDESNVDRYCSLLEKLSKECKTRFIVITHHRMTMARMDRLYGVTMSERGVSQLVSVDLKQHSLELDEVA